MHPLPALPPTDSLVLSPFFDDAPQGHDELERRSVQDNDELMRHDGDWEEVVDSDYSTATAPLLTSIAGVLHPSDSSQAYVFCGCKYASIKVIPGTMGDTTARGSKFIAFDWPSLARTKFTGWIDTVLPIPNHTKQMYFFSHEDYALINADPGSSLLIDSVALTIFPLTGTPNDCVIDGPKNIIAEWPSLRDAGFKTIDAVLLNPVNSEQAYFFRGEQYVLVHILQGEFLLFSLCPGTLSS